MADRRQAGPPSRPGGIKICLVNRGTFIAAADRSQDLLAQPHQVGFELRQHGGGGEIPSERLVAVQQILGMLLNNNVDCIQQSLEIALLHKGRSEVRHDEIAHEHHALIRQMDEHGIVSFSSLHRDQLDACSSDLQLGATVDGDVRLEAAYVVEAEAFTEELLVESPRRIDFASNFFLIVASGIEPQARIQGAEIGVAANVVPVRVGNEDGRQFRQGWARTLAAPRTRPWRNPAVYRRRCRSARRPSSETTKVVFRELETRERVHAARHDLSDAPRRKEHVLKRRPPKKE